MRPEHACQEHRNQAGLPVVRVHDVVGRLRGYGSPSGPFERRLTQKRKALGVVEVVVAVRAVEVVAIEIAGDGR